MKLFQCTEIQFLYMQVLGNNTGGKVTSIVSKTLFYLATFNFFVLWDGLSLILFVSGAYGVVLKCRHKVSELLLSQREMLVFDWSNDF